MLGAIYLGRIDGNRKTAIPMGHQKTVKQEVVKNIIPPRTHFLRLRTSQNNIPNQGAIIQIMRTWETLHIQTITYEAPVGQIHTARNHHRE